MTAPLFPKVMVDGAEIPHLAIAAEAQHHSAPRMKPGLAWQRAARALAVRHLLLAEARERQIAAIPADLGNGRRETEEEAQIRGFLDFELVPEEVTDDAVQATWSQDPTRFTAPPLWEVSHILCDTQREAEAVIAALDRTPEGFAQLARAESRCGSASVGGQLGQLTRRDTVPEFEAALDGLAAGEITRAPVKTRFGFHVIRMDAVAKGDVLPFDSVKSSIRDRLERTAWLKAARDYTQNLLNAAEISGFRLDA